MASQELEDKLQRLRLSLACLDRWLRQTYAKPSYKWPLAEIFDRVLDKEHVLSGQIYGEQYRSMNLTRTVILRRELEAYEDNKRLKRAIFG